MSRLEPGVDQLAPDVRQLLDARAQHVDALGARDLGVEAVAFWAISPISISLSGVISPAGTRGTTE